MSDDELNRLLGLLVRVSAELDMQLRTLTQELATPVGVLSWTPSKDELRLRGTDGRPVRRFSEVITIARRSMEARPVDPVYSGRLDKLLAAVEAAYERRNRYVHDPHLPIHLPERVPGGPTHRRIRLDQPAPQQDMDLDDLAELVVEVALLGRLCTATWAFLMQRRAANVQGVDSELDVEGPFSRVWEAFESRDPGLWLSALSADR